MRCRVLFICKKKKNVHLMIFENSSRTVSTDLTYTQKLNSNYREFLSERGLQVSDAYTLYYRFWAQILEISVVRSLIHK